MLRVPAQSPQAQTAYELVTDLQTRFVAALAELLPEQTPLFRPVEWFRDQGRHGGGIRYEALEGSLFNRASVNLSQVQYDDDPSKQLASATALSTIIHPHNPLAPSLHLHISWTELKSGTGYWRLMADLNPAIDQPGLKQRFEACLEQVASAFMVEAQAQGERYFQIPALERHRGISHFYLEAFATEDAKSDRELAASLGHAVIQTYTKILAEQNALQPEAGHYRQQLAYHTLYFFQVLTLDRGTTSGLLVHDQNDIGILGSLPAQIDRELLASWQSRLPEPQNHLLAALLAALPAQNPCPIDEAVKARLAQVVRTHYRQYPAALELQASGHVIPPTVANHAGSNVIHHNQSKS